MDATGLSTFARLRQRRHQQWLAELQQRLDETLGDLPCRVWLFGSRARGDWDGFSDTDLLVEADTPELAERGAEQLRRAGPSDSRQALSTATAVLAWVEQLDQPPR